MSRPARSLTVAALLVVAQSAAAQTILISGAKVQTLAGEPIEDGTVLIAPDPDVDLS